MRRNAVGSKRVLLVAYHLPPGSGSSGLQRTLRFAEYLPEYGWEPTVLSVRPAAYEAVDQASAPRPAGYEVVRTFCLDAARHLSIAKRYPRFAATPDRWASWRLWGVRAGIRAVRDRGIHAAWSTHPIALTDPTGDAGQLLAALGLPPGVPLESAAAIESAFPALIAALKTEALAVADRGLLGAYSRRALTSRLATLLDEVVDRGQAGHGRH